MATAYTLFDISTGNAVSTFARKDGAIKAAERDSLLAYEIQTDTGKVVHAVDNRPAATETPDATSAPEPKKENNMTDKATPSTALEFNHGARYFFPQMGAGAVRIAESLGLSASLDNKTGSIVVEGGNAKERKAAITQIDKFLVAEYAAFKEWKKENKEARKEWYGSKEGRAAMTEAETAFFTEYADNHLSVL